MARSTTIRSLCLALLLASCDQGEPFAPGPPSGAELQPAPPTVASAATNVWTLRAPMPSGRSGLAVGVVNGVLYALGGANGVSYLTKNEAYTPGTNSWATKA